jgi:hypothetical protein
MRAFRISLGVSAVLVVALFAFTGCESTDGSSVSGGVYYGTGFHDPWYYGGYYDSPDIIVTPPPRPDRPVARPMPSIPSTPRPMPRGGMRR